MQAKLNSLITLNTNLVSAGFLFEPLLWGVLQQQPCQLQKDGGWSSFQFFTFRLMLEEVLRRE
jgi:hypothetical protein